MGLTESLARAPEIDLLGMRLSRIDRKQVVRRVFAALAERRGGWIVTPNVDHLRRFVREPEMRALQQGADLVVADGMPLLWAASIQGTPLPERVAGSDLVWDLAAGAAAEGRSLFLLGGDEGVAGRAADQLRQRFPDLQIAGAISPWVSSEPTQAELAELREKLAGASPDLVYVALGAPKQERVIAALRGDFPGTWWIGVGISLSFITGEVSRAPAWMQRFGVEWLHRMVQEPGRLARRYLIEDLPFALWMVTQAALRRVRGPSVGRD